MTTPDWFTRAIAAPAQACFVESEGTRIHYLDWNREDTAKPGLVFIHGFRAHARWWSFIAPFFVEHFRVVALDLAGMGDSGPRALFSREAFYADLAAVIADARLTRTTLVGHSFGGSGTFGASVALAGSIVRSIVIDTYVPLPGIKVRDTPPLPVMPKKVYATYEAARARFRLVPDQPCDNAYLVDHIAHHSLKQVGGGWTWKFDEQLRPRFEHVEIEAERGKALLARIEVPLTFIYGATSKIVNQAQADAIIAALPHGRGPVVIPEAHHHVMLDQPLALIAAIRASLY